MNMSADDLITSEVNSSLQFQKTDCDTVISTFTLTLPIEHEAKAAKKSPKYDEDGDLIRETDSVVDILIHIEHKISSDLAHVGLQVWNGALFLADFLIQNKNLIKFKTLLEIGAGTGLTSIAASKFCDAKRTIASDIKDVLQNLKANVDRNASNAQVMELDLFKKESQILDDLKIDIVMGADVIYDNDLSDAIIAFMQKMALKNDVHLFLFSIEKRYIFTTDDLDTVAPCYEYFMSRLLDEIPGVRLITHDNGLIRQSFCYERSPDLLVLEIHISQ